MSIVLKTRDAIFFVMAVFDSYGTVYEVKNEKGNKLKLLLG